MNRPLVTIRNLQVHLGDRTILHGINAELLKGEITALIGLNGSGKTTLLRSLIREVPYSGEIKFHCAHDHTHQRPDQVGYVPQKLRIDAHFPLTVADLLALATQRRPLFLGIRSAVREQMRKMLQVVSLHERLLDQMVEKLSGGELQRVLLALALQPHPELLLLDEPAAGIDVKHAEEFYDLLTRLNRDSGVTILLVSHDLSVVNRHAHRVMCLQDGRIACEGPPHEIMSQAVLKQTFGKDTSLYSHSHQAHD